MVTRAAVQVVEGAWWAGIEVMPLGIQFPDIDDYYEDLVVEVYAPPAVVEGYYARFEIVAGEILMEDREFTALEEAFFAAGDALAGETSSRRYGAPTLP